MTDPQATTCSSVQRGTGTNGSIQSSASGQARSSPWHCSPRPVPFALKVALERKLERVEEMGVERATHSDWVVPIVAVPKEDCTFRLCWSYKSKLSHRCWLVPLALSRALLVAPGFRSSIWCWTEHLMSMLLSLVVVPVYTLACLLESPWPQP